MKRLNFEKSNRVDKLSRTEQESLVFDLVNAIVQAQSLGDAALFLQDLLTKKEMQSLSKRLRIAKLLLSGLTYEEIEKQLHTSHGTVAKIAAWLAERGDGFRKIITQLPKESKTKNIHELSDWDRIKRRYSIYFWPELLLEEIVKSANKSESARIQKVLQNLDKKSELHKRISSLLHREYTTT